MPADRENNHNPPKPHRVTVYAAASDDIQAHFHESAGQLGCLLAQSGMGIVYGGGRAGLMGTLADAALANGGEVFGIIPEWLVQREVAHTRLTDLQVVPDMRIRKERMLLDSQAVIALPGGVGTLEELFEAITLKRMGLYNGDIILLNTANYYGRLLDFLSHAGEQRFIVPKAGFLGDCWQVADNPEQALSLLRCTA